MLLDGLLVSGERLTELPAQFRHPAGIAGFIDEIFGKVLINPHDAPLLVRRYQALAVHRLGGQRRRQEQIQHHGGQPCAYEKNGHAKSVPQFGA
jgi:hypothetical protein